MDKLPRFAKVFAGRRRIVEMDISLRLRSLAEFFNSLLANSRRDYLNFSPLKTRESTPQGPALLRQKLFGRPVYSEHAFLERPNAAVVGFVSPRFRGVFGTGCWRCARPMDQSRWSREGPLG